MQADNIWMASSERFNKTLKSLVYDDKGFVVVDVNTLTFHGRNGEKTLDDVKSVSLVNSKFGWGNFLFATVFTILYNVVAGRTYIFTAFVLLFVLFIFLLLRFKQKWILINYKKDNKDESLYLSDGSGLGWGGMFGGTEKLYTFIQKALKNNEKESIS